MSTKAQRYTQHRPERETKNMAKQLRHLKGENHKLAKQNARLRKDLAKASLQPVEEPEIRPEYLTETPEEFNERMNKPSCPKCNSVDIAVLTVIGRTYHVCRECKHRERVAA